MNTPVQPRAVRFLYYAALLIALFCGAAAAWLVGADQIGAAVILAVAMLSAMSGAMMLDFTEGD